MRADTATLAIDVGATRTRIALLSHGAITTRTDMPTLELAPRGTGLGDGLVRAARALLANAGEGPKQMAIGAVGVSLAASVDEDGNVVQERDFGIPAGGVLREELVGGRALAGAASAHRATSVQPSGARILTPEAFADPLLRPLGERALEGWALIIATVSAIVDPEIVVLTGSVAADAAHLLDALRRRVAELVALPPEIVLGSLGPDAELLGADLFARAALVGAADRYARAGLSAQSTGERR